MLLMGKMGFLKRPQILFFTALRVLSQDYHSAKRMTLAMLFRAPKGLGVHCKSFPENRKNLNFLEPRIFVFHYR